MSWRDAALPLDPRVLTSRAINLSMDEADVSTMCAKFGLTISSIETLLSGGTRVVLQSSEEAAQLKRKLKTKVLQGAVSREAWASHRG